MLMRDGSHAFPQHTRLSMLRASVWLRYFRSSPQRKRSIFPFSRVIQVVSRGVTQPYAHVRTNGPLVSQMGRHSPHSPSPFPTAPGSPSKAKAAHRVSSRLVCIVLLLSSDAGLTNGPCSSLGAVFATPKFWDSLLSG